jgi:hypothetical protein
MYVYIYRERERKGGYLDVHFRVDHVQAVHGVVGALPHGAFRVQG